MQQAQRHPFIGEIVPAVAPNMAQRETADSEEQRVGGNTLLASRDSEEEGRNTTGEVADKTIGSRKNSDMAPPDLEVSNKLKTPLNPQTTQDGPDTGSAEGDGAKVVQQVKVHDPAPAKDKFKLEQSLDAATQNAIDHLREAFEEKNLELQNAINKLEKAFEQKVFKRAEPQREIDDFTQKVTTQSNWIVIRIRRTVVDVMIARAIASCMLEDYRAMESHVLNAFKHADSLNETELYESLQKRCQYIMGVALYYQQRFQDAADAFGKAKNCPAAPGISLRDAKEWRHVIKEALQAPQESSFPEQREDVSDSETTPTQERRTSVLAPFPSRKLSSIDEEIEAGESNNHSARSTAERPLEQALPSPGNTPLIRRTNPWSFRPDVFQHTQPLKDSASARPSMLRSVSIRSNFALAFASSRSRAASMNEDEINAAFGGGGAWQSNTNTPAPFDTPRASWASGFEKEEISVGDDDLGKQRWAEWKKWIRDEDELFKRDELRFKSEMEMKYKEQRKESEGKEDWELRRKRGKMTPKEQKKDAEAKEEERLRKRREGMTPEEQRKDSEAMKEERLRRMRGGLTRLRIGESARGGRRSPSTTPEDRRGSGSRRPRRQSLLREEA